MDAKLDALNRAGLLGVPVMLWAIEGGGDPKVNLECRCPKTRHPARALYGGALGREPCRLDSRRGRQLFRRQRREVEAHRPRRIRAEPHAPVMMHPQGMHWIGREFKDEKWMDLVGYQSGHGDDEKTLRWLWEGPLTTAWTNQPFRPVINLEPPYENHIRLPLQETAHVGERPARHLLVVAQRAHGRRDLRRPRRLGLGRRIEAADRSSLHRHAAAVEKGADHAGRGTHGPPGGVFHVHRLVAPAPDTRHRGEPTRRATPAKFVAAASTDLKDLVLVYIPEERTVEVLLEALPPSPTITWFNPRTGEKSPAVAVVTANTCQFPTPSEGDWIMWMKSSK